jgi:hypothetical protein
VKWNWREAVQLFHSCRHPTDNVLYSVYISAKYPSTLTKRLLSSYIYNCYHTETKLSDATHQNFLQGLWFNASCYLVRDWYYLLLFKSQNIKSIKCLILNLYIGVNGKLFPQTARKCGWYLTVTGHRIKIKM